ncbi:galanin receptor 2b isoform X2 [Stigmatopora nigra]
MADTEDLTKPTSPANVSETYPVNPASVIVSVVFSLIFLLGTVGNSLVLAVLLRSGQLGYNTTNLFILNLSVADFFFIIFCVPFQATIYSLDGWVFGSFMCKAVHFFINLTMYASSFTLAAVSVDRYLAIRYPLRSRELRTPCNAVAAMVVIWGLSLVFAGPYLSYYRLIHFANGTMCIPGWDERQRKLLDTCTFLLGYVVPVLVVSLSYTRTIKYLWTAVDPLDGMTESKRAKRKHFRKGFKKVFSCLLSKKARNKVHVVHVANTAPGFEPGSTEVSHMNEENARHNGCEMTDRRPVQPREPTVTLNSPFRSTA